MREYSHEGSSVFAYGSRYTPRIMANTPVLVPLASNLSGYRNTYIIPKPMRILSIILLCLLIFSSLMMYMGNPASNQSLKADTAGVSVTIKHPN